MWLTVLFLCIVYINFKCSAQMQQHRRRCTNKLTGEGILVERILFCFYSDNLRIRSLFPMHRYKFADTREHLKPTSNLHHPPCVCIHIHTYEAICTISPAPLAASPTINLNFSLAHVDIAPRLSTILSDTSN